MTDRLSSMLSSELGSSYEDIRAAMADRPGFRTRNLAGVTHYGIHHTGGPRNQSWRAIRDYHQGKGWSGIGYHIGIRMGKVSYIGDISLARACVGGFNHRVICVVFTGNYQNIRPDAQDLALARAVVSVLDQFIGRKPLVAGHGDLPGQSTVCPGVHLKPYIAGLRTGAVTRPPADPDFAKVTWFLEDTQRRCEAEGLFSEAQFIGREYTADAIRRRDR